jgi:hypothetical protein
MLTRPVTGESSRPAAADSALPPEGLVPDEERIAGELLCAVAGSRFCVFPDRPTQLQDSQHNCGSQDAKKDDFSEMFVHRELLLRIRCGNSRKLSNVTRAESTVETLI